MPVVRVPTGGKKNIDITYGHRTIRFPTGGNRYVDVRFTPARKTNSFTPSQIAGLALWLDASVASSVTVTSSPDVDSWADVSGQSITLSQPTAAQKPDNGSTINGLNAISFDGVDDWLRQTSIQPFTGNVGTAFAVFRFPTSVPTATNGNLLAAGTTASNKYVCPLRFQSVSSSLYFSAGSFTAATANIIRGGTALEADKTYLGVGYSTGSAFGLRLNGAAESSIISSGANNGLWFDDATLDNVALGKILINTATAFFTGLVGEVIYYDNVTLTAQQISDVEQYLAGKWGVTLS